jgi:hypothetical protein
MQMIRTDRTALGNHAKRGSSRLDEDFLTEQTHSHRTCPRPYCGYSSSVGMTDGHK